MRKAYFASCVVFCYALLSTCLYAQSNQQTTVTKFVSDNPTLAIVQFDGTEAAKKQLLNTLYKCDWFRILPDKQAAKAQIRLQVRHRDNPHAYDAQVTTAAQAPFLCSGRHDNLNEASFALVDEILKKLFNVPAYCTRRIAFVLSGQNHMKEIYSCFLDGSGQERITNNAAISTEPDWGHRNAMVYTMARNNSLSVVLVDMLNKRQRVISQSWGLNSSASLSPDGQFVALTLSRERRVDLYVKDLASNKERRLTNDICVESSPCWAPDGQTICFVSDKVGKPQLYLLPVQGGKAQRLQTGGNECVSPDWSIVSNKLCYSTKSNSGQYVLAVLDMKQKNPMPQIITAAAGNWEAPSWAPDGRHLVCVRSSGRNRDLYIVDSWLKSITPISQGANLALPAWAPAF
ncbi:MAG: hypothetical protein GX927_07995 [Lentisphaerae bacterium]|jgi:TolB protein|nr:hypothetical protein [Lentisphaerota bacterium]